MTYFYLYSIVLFLLIIVIISFKSSNNTILAISKDADFLDTPFEIETNVLYDRVFLYLFLVLCTF